ncbi:helix-turn-helix transcriptional regulator [Clostridium sp. WLY-B-L2]|jgi:transcriptional regulator with XRE-family HTH domain|uniref:Helix-turn-helix transcriptional regulator n=1 Tax=Clostridium aromativorans TaxID=2836848 RepID=A0ABS8N3J8_9CLOT|nr:helix-turn-helix transcriptional regulator [Clostridium aromativorans]MCC9294385.1 helix-turn-helix transcriptional regulator [Clostridium aromativorans]
MLEVNQNKFLLALAKAGMTTTDLEAKAKVGRTTISKVVNGNTKIRPALVGKLAKALNVDVEQIVDFK